MFCALLFVSSIVLIVYTIYKWAKSSNQYFEERNLKYTGISAFVRGIYEMISGKFEFFESRLKSYYEFPDES